MHIIDAVLTICLCVFHISCYSVFVFAQWKLLLLTEAVPICCLWQELPVTPRSRLATNMSSLIYELQ